MAKPTGLEIPSPLSLAIPVRNSFSGSVSYIFYLNYEKYNIAFSENDSEKIEGFGVTVDEVHFHAQCWTCLRITLHFQKMIPRKSKASELQ
jgi:hypothetical protein